MIECFSSYCLGDTCSLLLEYADFGTLEDYLHGVEEPKDSIDIVNFWDGLLRILVAVMTLHAFDLHADFEEGLDRMMLMSVEQALSGGEAVKLMILPAVIKTSNPQIFLSSRFRRPPCTVTHSSWPI